MDLVKTTRGSLFCAEADTIMADEAGSIEHAIYIHLLVIPGSPPQIVDDFVFPVNSWTQAAFLRVSTVKTTIMCVTELQATV